MANFGKLTLTSEGLRLQALAEGGTPLQAKRIAMGSGRYVGSISTLTALVTEEVSVNINESRLIDESNFLFGGYFDNSGLQTSFEWREVGLYMVDPDDADEEILFCYSNAGDSSDFIPASTDERYDKYINIQIGFDNAEYVVIQAPESSAIVSRTEYEEYKASQSTLILQVQADIDNLLETKTDKTTTQLLDARVTLIEDNGVVSGDTVPVGGVLLYQDDLGVIPSGWQEVDLNITNPNILENSDFRSPINQRGQTTYAKSDTWKYTIDRWRTKMAVTVNDGSITVSNSGDTTQREFQQIIGEVFVYKGGVLTFGISINEEEYVIQFDTVPQTGTTYKDILTGVKVGIGYTSSTGELYLTILIAGNTSVTIEYCKLEEGIVFTGMNEFNYVDELSKCRRRTKLIKTIMVKNNASAETAYYGIPQVDGIDMIGTLRVESATITSWSDSALSSVSISNPVFNKFGLTRVQLNSNQSSNFLNIEAIITSESIVEG